MRYVDITSEPYLVGREYKMRLEKEDFKTENIRKLAASANMRVKEFKKRFLYIVGVMTIREQTEEIERKTFIQKHVLAQTAKAE